MDVSDLRKKILRALEDARRDAAARRSEIDEATKAYEDFLTSTAVPLMRQAATVLRATGEAFAVHTPAGSVRLASESSPQTFIELVLDTRGAKSEVLGRVSVARGRQAVVVDERPIGGGRAVGELTEADVSAFLVSEIPKLVVRHS